MSFEGMKRRDFMKLAGATVVSNFIEKNSFENIDSDTPSNESIKAVFEILTEGKKSTERRKGKDENGIYLWEVEFEVDDGFVEFNYMRKGKHAIGGSAPSTKVHVIYFDADGMPEGGSDIAKFSNGQWTRDEDFFRELEDIH